MHHQRPEESAEDSLPGKAAASKTDVRYASEECVSSDDHHLVGLNPVHAVAGILDWNQGAPPSPTLEEAVHGILRPALGLRR